MPLTQAQLDLRAGRIGSSAIASIAGLNPWRGPFETWLEITGRKPYEPPNDAQLEGHEFEDVIGRIAARKLSIMVMRNDDRTWLMDDFAAATPDFNFSFDAPDAPDPIWNGVLECKRVGYRVMGHWQEGPPLYVLTQVQWQLAIIHRIYGYVAASVAGLPVEAHAVPYDANFAAGLLDIGREWHQRHVVRDQEPALDGSKAARDYLTRLYAKASGEIKEATPTVAALISRRKDLAAQLAAAKRDAKEIDAQLLGFIAGDKGVKHEGEYVTRTVVTTAKGGQYTRLNLPRTWTSEED